jgi:hypothetical protein
MLRTARLTIVPPLAFGIPLVFEIPFVFGIWAVLLAPAAFAQNRFEVDAVIGQPFGVGRIDFELPPNMLPDPLGIDGLGLDEKDHRVLYPTFDSAAFGKVMRGLLQSETPLTAGGPVRRQVGGILRGIFDRPPRMSLYFLFRGADVLELSIEARTPLRVRAIPRQDPAAHARLLQAWWKQYSMPRGVFETKPDYPPVVENYLLATLARRLDLRLPEEQQTPSAQAELRRELGLNLGTESLRMAMQQDRILGLNNLSQPADQPLPQPVEAPAPDLPEPSAEAAIEPLAMHVPAECFYARFGSFANFLWMQDTLAKWGGDLQNLIALRGLDRGMSTCIERQLVLKQTVLSRLLGNTVIADVAMIGTDVFFREGASYGILFQARNNLALAASLNQQRQERVKAGGVTEENVTIAGRKVSYLSATDGSVRSYYAVEGDFHFITTSRTLLKRFFAVSSGQNTSEPAGTAETPGALGALKEFRHARAVMPTTRNDTIWLYVSDAFFRNLTGPHYRVEMARRLQAAADISLVEIAQLAAVAEGQPGDTIEQLEKASLLPPEFGPLPDGSRIVLQDGALCDSVRGRRGAFVPVADMPVDKVTRAEAAEYQRFADFYRTNWGRMDPLVAAIKRTALPENRERVVLDLRTSSLAPHHFTMLEDRLGTADSKQLAAIAGDMAALDLVLKEQRIFAGLRDVGRPPAANFTTFLPLGRLRDFLLGYVGTTGELGLLEVLNLGIPPQSDPAGYAASRLGGWRREFQSAPNPVDDRSHHFTVFSFQKSVLDEVVPQLHFEPAPRPAQIRLRVDDVSQARITPALNDLGYARTRATSLGNLRLLASLHGQLHVPLAACKNTAESLVDAKLICPLGGHYVLREGSGLVPHWTSTYLESAPPPPHVPSPPGTAGPPPPPGASSGPPPLPPSPPPAPPQSSPGGLIPGLTGVAAPPGYLSPPLSWFRGLDLDATLTEKALSAHAEVIMQMP